MKWFKYDENGVKQYAPQLMKIDGQYVKPSESELESMGYEAEVEEQHIFEASQFTCSDPKIVAIGDNIEQLVLKSISSYDNSIVVQEPVEENIAEDVSFIQCFYGHSKLQVKATKRALLFNIQSKPKFGQWIFIEAQVDDIQEFKWLEEHGIEYKFIKIPEKSKWLFLKWPLWNIGLENSAKKKFAFADSDVVFCSSDWAKNISKSLNEFDVESLSKKCYYAEQSFAGDDESLDTYKGLLNTTGSIAANNAVVGHPGFTFGFNKKFLDKFKKFDCLASKHGDVVAWKKALNLAKQFSFKVGCAEGICCHVSHGFLSNRSYEQSKDIFKEANASQADLIIYEEDNLLPVWNEQHPLCNSIRDKFKSIYFDVFCNKDGPILLDKNLTIEEVRAAVQKKINDSIEDKTNFVVPIVQNADEVRVDDIAIVECLFGTNEEQVNAAKKAMSFQVKSKQIPAEWVFVEAQYDESLIQMRDFCSEHGIKYVFKQMTHESDGIFIKNALWNIGARMTKAPKLMFIDSDVAFSNAHWLEETSKLLDSFEVVQPFSEIWWSEELANDDEHKYFSANFRKSFVNSLKNKHHADIRIHAPGYALSMQRSFFDSIVGIDVLPSNGSDAWFWLKNLPPKIVMKSELELPLLGDDYSYMLEPDDVSYANNIAFHVKHGSLSGRKYHETLVLNQKFCNKVNDTIDYDLSSQDLPKFKNTKVAQAHQACILRCRSTNDSVDDIFNEEKFKVYERISKDNKVIFLTVLNNDSGREVMSHSIVKIHKFLIDKYCLDPHEYWCLTNEKIDSINTIPFELDTNRDIIGWNAQYELFRNIFPDHPVMTLDFDCVPTKLFTLHDVPNGYFSMMYQTNNSLENVPNVLFNCGSMFFKGDFSFIFDEYKKMLNSGVPASMYFTTIQDFIAYQMLLHNISVNNILNVADIFLLKINHPLYKKSYFETKKHTFIHYLGNIKPWNMSKLKQLGLRYLVPSEFLTFDGDF